MTIKVKEVIEKNIAMSTEDGKKLYDKLHYELLNSKEKITLTFQGIDILISHFLTESIGKLYGTFKDWEKLDISIEITDLEKDDMELLKKTIIPNSKNHFKDTKRSDEIEIEILKK